MLFYDITGATKDYANFLRQHEPKIPRFDYDSKEKFVCGIVFSLHGLDYFAPVSHFKKQQFSNVVLENDHHEAVSSIRLGFMFPIPKELLKVKDFSAENPSYKRLLNEEIKDCRIKEKLILTTAKRVYDSTVIKKHPLSVQNNCDFKLLEKKCYEYSLAHGFDIPDKLKYEQLKDNSQIYTYPENQKAIVDRLLTETNSIATAPYNGKIKIMIDNKDTEKASAIDQEMKAALAKTKLH